MSQFGGGGVRHFRLEWKGSKIFVPFKFLLYLFHFGWMTTDGNRGLSRVKQRSNIRPSYPDQVSKGHLGDFG